METVIRKAIRSDAPAIAELIGQLNGKVPAVRGVELRLEFIDMSPIEELFVCEAEEGEAGVLLGMMGFRLRENIEDLTRYGEISILVTNRKYRRQGIGRKLMAFAESMAASRGCIGTWLVSGTAREEAHQFYRSLGYEITGYRFVKKRNGEAEEGERKGSGEYT